MFVPNGTHVTKAKVVSLEKIRLLGKIGKNKMRKMKDSGIEWIGEIPEDWDVIRLRYLCEIFTGNQDTQDNVSDGIYPFYVRSPIVEKSNKYTFEGPAILMAGDGVGAGKIFHYVDGKYGCHQRVYSLQHIHNVNRRYLYYYLQNLFYISIETANTKSTVDSVRLSMLQDFPIAMPTFEQQKIADFLDCKCSEIDSVISKTRETIEEYKKLKQSIITEVVTGKVKIENGKVCGRYDTYKDSGIEWIGEIPSEWEVKPIKALFSFGKGLPITKDNLTETGLSVVSYGQIHSKNNIGTEIRNELIRYVDKIYYETNPQSLVHKGDFIFADTSEDLTGCGNFVYVNREEDLFAGYHTIILFSKEKNDNKYLAYLFQTDCWRRQIRCCCSGVKLFSISRRILGSTNLILPSILEQQQISDFLDKKCSEIDALITKKEQLVVELEAYKKSLIYEVVTGKREV